ncbi:hypothetical protein AVL55_05010 [Alteromonas macleodii]|uniref:LicD/FKTN/FKRP nucleotidyltransferase domain-containing protein n=2 Tax=Alteromonas macleodii TaxID=28108 RepID=A0A126PX96_ALTMA|nr:hypothetical protein AVL55_05010 [Alteromonas macleodii]
MILTQRPIQTLTAAGKTNSVMNYQLNKIYSEYASVHQVCREALAVSDAADIHSILIGGSLLGMVRDKDFLPWDKDVDFCVYQDQAGEVFSLEANFREAGFECRKHYVGVRTEQQLASGLALLHAIAERLSAAGISYVLATGALLSLYRDGALSAEADTLALLIPAMTEPELSDTAALFNDFSVRFSSVSQGLGKGLTLEHDGWRINLFNFNEVDGKWFWRDLNCEHWVDANLLEAPVSLNVGDYNFRVPKQTEAFLEARYGSHWHVASRSKFSHGRLPAFLQVYKAGVMVDYIIHYQIVEKTYWFEPNANVISTAGFLPTEIQPTTAGDLCFPVHPEIFLQEHYGEWQTPVKTWNGAVDNPTLVPNKETLERILTYYDRTSALL